MGVDELEDRFELINTEDMRVTGLVTSSVEEEVTITSSYVTIDEDVKPLYDMRIVSSKFLENKYIGVLIANGMGLATEQLKEIIAERDDIDEENILVRDNDN